MKAMTRMSRSWVAAIGFIMLLAGAASAQVTGTVPNQSVPITGGTISAPFSLSVGDAGTIDGINGELKYDPTVLSSPSVTTAAGSTGFIAEGNDLDPDGDTLRRYRFVLYKNPPDTPLNLTQPVLNFGFNVAASAGPTINSNVSFTIAAAARVLSTNPANVVSLGVGGGQAVTFSPFTVTVQGIPVPVIVQQPQPQTVLAGSNVVFDVKATGQGALTYNWTIPGAGAIGAVAQSPLNLNAVDASNAGNYSVRVANAGGFVDSNAVALTVVDSGANNATFVGSALPFFLQPGETEPIQITFQNTGALSWSNLQNVSVATVTDTDNILTENTLSISGNEVVPIGGQYTFIGTIAAPAAAGSYSVTVSMTDGSGLFGAQATIPVTVNGAPAIEFTADTQSWFGGVLPGAEPGVGVTSGPTGLCMTTVLLGDNGLGWLSPNPYVSLVDKAVYRIVTTMSTDQTAENAIPFWDLTYENFPGNAYAGQSIFIDVAGGANGVGRPQGRTTYEMWATPNAVNNKAWRGTLSNGIPGENDNSIFTTRADASNDMRFVVRVMDLASGPGINANLDFGTVCMSGISITTHDIDSLAATTIFNPPVVNANYGPERFDQMGAGTAVIDDPTATANFALLPGDLGGRKTLFPWDKTLCPESGGTCNLAAFYPLAWVSNTLYKARISLRSNVGGAGGTVEGTDPLKIVNVIFDAKTNEVITNHVTTRGTRDYATFAASPRLLATTGGQPEEYVGFYYSHNKTVFDPLQDPDAGSFRMQADFFNIPSIAPEGAGADAFSVSKIEIDTVIP